MVNFFETYFEHLFSVNFSIGYDITVSYYIVSFAKRNNIIFATLKIVDEVECCELT